MKTYPKIGVILSALVPAVTLVAQTLYVPGGTVETSTNNKVGVGISTPSAAFDVRSGAENAIFAGTGGAAAWAAELHNFDGGGDRYVKLAGGNYSALFMNGSVGVGTTTPIARLAVVGNSVGQNDSGIFQITTGTGANTDNKLTFGVDDSGYSWMQAVKPGENYKNLILNPTGGNVGIANTSPRERLQIGDGIAFHDGGWKGLAFNSYYNGGWRALTAGSTSALLWDTSVGALRFINGPSAAKDVVNTDSERFTILNNGNVGIGIGSPSHKLTVNGTIRAKEVIVDTGWADYVFAEDYRLAPLSEVEAHIKEHKHLPGVPSAAEVAEQGVSMGEMQARMMAKIEELTLHVIAQEKRMAEQNRLNARLLARVEELESALK